MSRNFDFIFYPKKPKNYISGPAKVYLRITIDGRRAETATARVVDPGLWNPVAQRLNGKSLDIKATNRYIDILQSKLYECHSSLLQEGIHVTAELLRNNFAGRDERDFGLLEVLNAHHENMKKLVGIDFEKSTFNRFASTINHIKAFILWKYNLSEIYLKQLKYPFIADFEFYLKAEKKNGNNTIEKHIQNLKRVISTMVKRGAMKTNPFADFKIKRIIVDRLFLTEEELNTMAKKVFLIDRVSQVRDIFIFSCYTGLSYIDVFNLKPDNLVTGIDGGKWIFTIRQKTGTQSNIPLLKPALEIIKKYKDHPIVINKNALLPVISNQKMNAYLKEVADLCAIKKDLTFHCARHTFATTVTLTNDVPIESVSKMLGHKKIQTTQHYAKILDKKVSNDMLVLRSKMEEKTYSGKLKKSASAKFAKASSR